MNIIVDTKTFETDCGKFFREYFSKINGYCENPEIYGKYPDFKIEPKGRPIYFEIYKPEAHKIRELKDKNNWKETTIGNLKCKHKVISFSLESIKSVICLLIKEKKKKNQLPKDGPNLLILDLSILPEESMFINDLFSFVDSSNLYEIFAIMPTLSGLIFYFPNKSIGLLINPTVPSTINGLSKEEKEAIKEYLENNTTI